MKRCNHCGKRKSLSTFNKNRCNKDGLQNQCRVCTKAWGKKYREVCNNSPTFVKHRRINALEYYSKRHKTLAGYLRHIFYKINNRCNNSGNDNYELFGGIGIKCLFGNAKEFVDHIINDLGIKNLDQIKGLLIDRVDITENFAPGNIRFVTTSQNAQSHRKQRTCHGQPTSSCFKGVSFRKDRKKFRAYIKHDDKYIHLGHFTSEIKAAEAYDQRAIELFGDFAVTNQMLGLFDEVTG